MLFVHRSEGDRDGLPLDVGPLAAADAVARRRGRSGAPVALRPADAGRPSTGGFSEHGDDAPAAKPAAAPPAPAPEPAAEPSPAAAPKWTVGEVNKMTVPKLKAALTELGLATDGLKKVLKERLLAAL